MSEQQKFEITVGMRVMVKVAAREIPATVIEVRDDCFIVRSDGTGREFKTNRVVDILDVPETESEEMAGAAAEIADGETAASELPTQEDEVQTTAEATENENVVDAPDAGEAVPEPQDDGNDGANAAPAKAEGEAKPRKNLSLVEAAVEVLKAEKRPMGVKELVKLATERGLWIPTKAKTPEQSLYGGLYLEMKNSAHPRIKKAAVKGCFELIG